MLVLEGGRVDEWKEVSNLILMLKVRNKLDWFFFYKMFNILELVVIDCSYSYIMG